MEKVIKNGKVAVLYSPGFGAGWYTWHEKKELLFSPELVSLVLNGEIGYKSTRLRDEQIEIVEEISKDDESYFGGVTLLQVEWVEVDRQFRVEEYDGNESLSFRDRDNDWISA